MSRPGARRADSVALRFGHAAPRYGDAAVVQRLVANRLARRIAAAGLPPQPRILEVGCGTGLLTKALRALLPDADWTLTDLVPAMLEQCRARIPAGERVRYLVMDAQAPALRGGGFDLVCGSLVAQWFTGRDAALRRLAALLTEGGLLALSTLCDPSFGFWRAALSAEGLADRIQPQASLEALQAAWPAGGIGSWETETLLQPHARGIEFLRGLRDLGADLPRLGTRPADPLALRRALRRFETAHGAVADYRVGYGLFRRAAPQGVFVTGTDTGIGKTLVSACLARAWDAHYWKPLQTGLAEEPGDSETVARLAGLLPARILPPCHALQAPLSPEAAARLEGVEIDASAIRLPAAAPLVVEGAGGLMVPLGGGLLMIDLIARLGLPVVLVACGRLGTINHTLLSLEALRARRIPVLGVVLNGEVVHGNREAIAAYGGVRIIAELPRMERVDAGAVAELARSIPPLGELQ